MRSEFISLRLREVLESPKSAHIERAGQGREGVENLRSHPNSHNPESECLLKICPSVPYLPHIIPAQPARTLGCRVRAKLLLQFFLSMVPITNVSSYNMLSFIISRIITANID